MKNFARENMIFIVSSILLVGFIFVVSGLKNTSLDLGQNVINQTPITNTSVTSNVPIVEKKVLSVTSAVKIKTITSVPRKTSTPKNIVHHNRDEEENGDD